MLTFPAQLDIGKVVECALAEASTLVGHARVLGLRLLWSGTARQHVLPLGGTSVCSLFATGHSTFIFFSLCSEGMEDE